MTRLLLRWINAPALILLALVGVAVQTSLFSFWPMQYVQPDIVLLIVIWCGLRRDFTEGGIITLIISDIAETHSAAPSGVFLITYMALYLSVRGVARLFVIPDLSSVVLVTLIMSVASKISVVALLKLLGASGGQWQHAIFYLFPEALINGMLGRWLYQWLERFDWVTFKTAQAERALADELQLESPEF